MLAARGYPVPEIVWHGPLDAAWYLVVERRLPGRPLDTLDEATLGSLLALVELQADAAIEAGPRDMAGYHAAVLFDGWDYVWRDAEAASQVLCAGCGTGSNPPGVTGLLQATSRTAIST